jgi:hypothetical protein
MFVFVYIPRRQLPPALCWFLLCRHCPFVQSFQNESLSTAVRTRFAVFRENDAERRAFEFYTFVSLRVAASKTINSLVFGIVATTDLPSGVNLTRYGARRALLFP